mgnify:CR=1 FL=1
MDKKEVSVEDAAKAIEFWIKKLEDIERKLRGRIGWES